MNFNHLLSDPGVLNEYPSIGEMGSQGFLRLGQKRGNEHLVSNISASEVITRRRLEADPIFSTKSLPSGQQLVSCSPRLTQLGFGPGSEATTEIPMFNRSAGILSLHKCLKAARFAEIDAKATTKLSDTTRILDSLNNKALHSSSYSAYTIPSEFKESDYNRQQMLSVYPRNAEIMRRALGKEINKSNEDTTCQAAVNKFTLNGEPVDNTSDAVSSEGLKERPIPVSYLGTNTRGLYSSSPYFYNIGNLGSDMGLSRGFYPSTTSFHSSLGLKIGRHTTGPSPLLSFEASRAAMQEAMRNSGKCPAEPEISKSVLKSITLRKKDREGSNIFPANVKSLLSTGIFDGVSVKYVSWDRTKNVRGTIQGTGYLCWCKECKKIKMVNAYQLEQHAGSKSKHPNDHIYFSNGESIYGVVQELKITPSDKLLEVIPTATGSGINTENFVKWKESFQLAGRKLQRIFGSDPEIGESSSSKNAANRE